MQLSRQAQSSSSSSYDSNPHLLPSLLLLVSLPNSATKSDALPILLSLSTAQHFHHLHHSSEIGSQIISLTTMLNLGNIWPKFSNDPSLTPMVVGKSSTLPLFLCRYPCSSTGVSFFSLAALPWCVCCAIRFCFSTRILYRHGESDFGFKSK